MRAAVVTVSDRSFRGERPDVSGPVLKSLAEAAGMTVIATVVIPDDVEVIARTLIELANLQSCEVILTTGGTGLSPRDVTPEATKRVIERELTGMEMAIHQESLRHTPFAMLSRAVVGVRGQTLIMNFPGSPNAVRECFAVVQPVLSHAVTLLRDENPYALSHEPSTTGAR
ncbi:MAG: MogA/MoaB family molybdenum cofactor biosynthesis protein [Candidatus Omnitrophica bacterium]|nr:MogA/MoaB family molybdenum cofactor biosynthesis protein [Candidatus Omnitrophota bacterium]